MRESLPTEQDRASIAARIDAATGLGLEFLRDATLSDGLWSDFLTKAGRSIDWVSGYVITMIAGVPGSGPLCERAIRSLVLRQRRSGGWGYNELIPEDCDSTAWVLRAILTSRFIQPAIKRSALACVSAHQDGATGGLRTYVLLDRISEVVGRSGRVAVRGWGHPHVCVSANAIAAMMEAGMAPEHPALVRALDYLQRSSSSAGLWFSYWWSGPLFGTFHAMLALMMAGRAGIEQRFQVALRVAELASSTGGWGDSPSSPPHPFATAHALLTLLLAPPDARLDTRIRQGIEWLLDRQLPDGSWPTVPILRIPDPEAVDSGDFSPARAPSAGTNIIVADDVRIFTTAVTLRALSRYWRALPVDEAR